MKKLLMALAAAALGTAPVAAQDLSWKVVKREYQGLPLFLRFPVNLDYSTHRLSHPVLFELTVVYSEATDNGLPVSGFNKAVLEPFDEDVFRLIQDEAKGYCALVETFAGKRHYYAYMPVAFDRNDAQSLLQSKFPALTLSSRVSEDKEWSFIRRYSEEYFSQ